MRTIAQLQAAGFQVRPTPDAIDCTDIVSATPFWYYTTKFAETMAEVHERLEAARSTPDGYVLTVAGPHWRGSEEPFPFNLLDCERKTFMDDARARYVTACNDATRAKADYEDALRTDEALYT